MPQRISKKTLYLNADKTKFVDEGDPEAAFLFVRAGSAVNESEAARLEKNGVKVNLSTEDHPDFDARAAHEAEFGPPMRANSNLEPADANDPDDAKAKAPTENKAVTRAPANKAAKE